MLMKIKFPLIILILISLALGVLAKSTISPARADAQTIQAPVLKWQKGGCYSSWCETGWYSSPAVADLDRDGKMEVIGSAYSIFVLDGETGSLEWQVKSGHDRSEGLNVANVGRTWPGVVVADVDGDNALEIVTAHSGGYVAVYNAQGYFEPGWPQRPAINEFRSLSAADLDGDGKMEIAAGLARLNHLNVWVFEPDGSLRPGWPQLSTDQGSAAGLYNDNIGLGDLDGDGKLELVIPSDTITIAAYRPDGSQLSTNTLYHGHPGHDMDFWAEVPAYVDLQYEIQGYGPCYDQPTARANFAVGPANIVDLNGDGANEAVAIGNVHDCHTSPYTDLYNVPYLFNPDRTRFNTGGYDWRTLPPNPGAPLSEDYNLIESAAPNPVTVDLDGDGQLEILYPSYDGRLHAFWLDKTEHGEWPYSVYNPSEGFYRFASEPAVADLDNDGKAEVIFASWVQKHTGRTGKLHILNYLGHPLQEIDLPPAFSGDWNGALPAPTLANIDSDPDLEVVLNTAHSGLVAYDLPGTAGARIFWGTGRGSYLRNGSPARGTLQASQKTVSRPLASPGDQLTYTILLRNPGPDLGSVAVTDTLPAGLNFAGNLSATSGSAAENNGVITWAGAVAAGKLVSVRFDALVDGSISQSRGITNMVEIQDEFGQIYQKEAVTIVNGFGIYLPLVNR
jgi:uncharacterized repeat protein (TIGR01451 family)